MGRLVRDAEVDNSERGGEVIKNNQVGDCEGPRSQGGFFKGSLNVQAGDLFDCLRAA